MNSSRSGLIMVEITFNKTHKIYMPFIIAVIFLRLRGEAKALNWVLFTHEYDGLTDCKVTLKEPLKGVELCYNIYSKINECIRRIIYGS